ncbi:SnoaL-like protein [Herbihabitans rhizosphaerae]|uniref:SnoaL-like protein n=1 Tax=Herbihabitans rhizosphaerae TaxID=1872711 RepID=A0A4Q7L5Z4_9PSEU|nr:nuclear transport factor 2 family protein [Herbihabitans rhizosphaerae]RZS45088.1 SnoaL-like protein [Herbihabitans rhizosphaerae]
MTYPWSDPISIAIRFNDNITRRDLDGLSDLMTEDHAFIDTEGAAVEGKAPCVEAWRGFFESFPDYRNIFTSIGAHGEVVTIVGRSVCEEPALDGPAIWTATVRDNKIVEWRVFTDSREVREWLGIRADTPDT